ncbi:hypothetical protein BJX61DRAFT_539394 [Aspergillus egyptiacus]|nr:hypothetical protein BJX61DRAFT_539394 [Aspergillus egyptiacus]
MMLPSSPSPSPSPSAPPPSSPTALLRPHPSNEVQVFGLAIGFAIIVFVCLAIATFLHAQFKSWSDISVKVNGDGWSVSGHPRAVFRFLRRESTKSRE